MKVLIIEDEPRAANRLIKLVQACDSSIQVLAVLESVKDSVSYLSKQLEVDLIFSDIQLTDDVSFKIFKQVEIDTPIIFTTAYNEYAIDAFKTNGIDYLLKPIVEGDVKKALAKFKKMTRVVTPNIEQLAKSLINQQNHGDSYKTRFMVKVGQHLKRFIVDDINAFYSKDKATYLLTKQGRSYAIDYTLDHLETVLNPEFYFRINRHFITGLEASEEIVAYSNSRLKLTVKGLEGELIIVSRERTKGFKEWLGG